MTSPFHYRSGALHVEDVPVRRIAAEVGTPVYCYSAAALREQWQRFSEAFAAMPVTICYSLKANSNLAVIKLFAALGAGADVVSEGELRRALKVGIPPSRIVFSGVGKTRAEMRHALEAGILQFNVESEPELEALNAEAAALGVTAPVALRINPGIDPKTHDKIATGKAEAKFGIPWERAEAVYAQAAALPHIRPVGLDIHIGSQLTDLSPFAAAFERIVALTRTLRAGGYAVPRLDLGGGLGISYRDESAPNLAAYTGSWRSNAHSRRDETTPNLKAYAEIVRQAAGDLGCEILLEPGRALVGNAGILASEVLYVKVGATKTFIVVDAAMNDLIRPSFYDAYHEVIPLSEAAGSLPLARVDFVGPVCETGDVLASDRLTPPLAAGDMVAFLSAGAYGAVMASTYNTRPLVPEVLVDGARFAVIRRRPSYDELLAVESLPDWLGGPGG